MARGFLVTAFGFRASGDLEWNRGLVGDTFEVCLNQEGTGRLDLERASLEFGASSVAFYRVGAAPCRGGRRGLRAGGQRHRMVTVTFDLDYLRSFLGSHRVALNPGVQEQIWATAAEPPSTQSAVSLSARPMRQVERDLLSGLTEPPVTGCARGFYYRAKVVELISLLLFAPRDEEQAPFCVRQQRIASDRVERVRQFLSANLDSPLELKPLARQVGCSPFYLSRLFSEATGMTISQYFRKLRIDRAAELLASGRYNVSEAAVEVGYLSPSHFSKAFRAVKGCQPSEYNR